MRTPAGTLLHTGDFKMDQLPLDGRLTDLRAFARLGEEGVDLFLTDSTNAEVPGFTTPERDIAPGHRPGVPPRRSAGSSSPASPRHVHRVQQVLDAAEKAGRKVAMVGRSMVRNMGIAADLGYLHVPDGVLVDVKKLDDLPDDQVVLICTGSQGEPMAALSRMANRDHRIDVGAGDTVLLASSLIPGNENAVYRVINGLMRLGANVVHKGNAKVHVSGPRQRRRAALLLQHRQAAQRHAGARRVAPPAWPTPSSPSPPASRATAWCSPRTASSSTSSTGVATVVGAVAVRLRLRRRLVASAAPTEALLKDRRILRDEGFISVIVVRRRGHRQDRRRPGDPRPAGSPRTTRSSSRSCPKIEQAHRGGRRARASRDDLRSCSRSSAARSAAGSAARSAAGR